MNSVSAPASPVPYVRKITPKTVSPYLGIDLLTLPRPVQPRVLYDLYGMVFSAVIKPDRSGQGRADSIQFKGQFEAINPATGEVICESGVAYIPVMDAILFSALESAKKRDDKAEIALAIRIGLTTAPIGKVSATGYEFDVQKLLSSEHKEDSALERLKALVRQQVPTLPRGAPNMGGVPVADAPAADAVPSGARRASK